MMKGPKKLFSLLLIFSLLLTFVSCGGGEDTTVTGENKTQETSENKKSDEEQIAEFITAYRAGEYDDKKYFAYEDLTEYITLAPYEGMKYPEDDQLAETVTDEAVMDYLIRMVLNTKVTDDEYTEVTSGALQKWDVVTVDYKSIMNGEEIANATASGEELLLGSGTYIPGFESGMIGKKFDKEIRLDLHFSPYYSAKDMADQDITFFVTVKKVQRPKIPEITVELINEMYSTSFQDMDAVKKDLKEDMDAAQASRAQASVSSYLENDLLRRSTVKKYPDKEVNHYIEHFIEYYAQYVEDGSTLEKFCEEELGMTYDEFVEDARAYAQETVGGTLMILAVCQKENITCSDEQMKAMIQGLFDNQNGYYANIESFLADYVDIYGADYFELQVKSAAALEKIKETAVKVAR
ncbi:MAG: FKBP-type peptidyl-prolyl cis-trans isomerase [Clostridia bacterium]|nr:FKBP-type peptidyl-prolyl cis-trans isomerase [Clostridia bacterium]